MALWVTLVFLAGGAALVSASSPPSAEELKAAINQDYKFSLTNWDSAILNDTLSNLYLEHIAWSAKPPRFQFTIFTQLSIDRLPTLFNMCTTFTGPLSAAVFLPLVQPPGEGPGGGGAGAAGAGGGGGGKLSVANAAAVAEAVERVKGFHQRVEALESGCQLDLMLFYEAYDSPNAALLYPVNYLRNYARLQVRTALLAMIDVDMLLSASLSEEMERAGSVAAYEAACAAGRATVLPAFEPTRPGHAGRAMARNISRMSKDELRSVHGRNKVAMQFKLRVFPRGHTPTNYTRWFEAAEPYHVPYKRFYEPWFITCWEAMPWYDIGFRGYGMNKIVTVASMAYYNATFWVHPAAWLVHNPHQDTEVRKLVADEASRVNKHRERLPATALYRKLTLLFGAAKRGMVRGTYAPRTDPRVDALFGGNGGSARLAWLRPPPKLVGSPTPESVFI